MKFHSFAYNSKWIEKYLKYKDHLKTNSKNIKW